MIEEIHSKYFQAGADIVETNTFNSTAISQTDYGTESLVPELNAAGEDVSVQVLLPQPPTTAEVIAKLPIEILNRLMEEVASINPQRTPVSQEATGSPS